MINGKIMQTKSPEKKKKTKSLMTLYIRFCLLHIIIKYFLFNFPLLEEKNENAIVVWHFDSLYSPFCVIICLNSLLREKKKK